MDVFHVALLPYSDTAACPSVLSSLSFHLPFTVRPHIQDAEYREP